MRRILVGCLVLSTSVFAGLKETERKQCEEWMNRGKQEADKRHYQEAQMWYYLAHQLMEEADDFGDGQLLLREGDLFRKQGKHDEAFAMYEWAVEKGSERVGAEALGKMSIIEVSVSEEIKQPLKYSFAEIQKKENKASSYKAECWDNLVDAFYLYKDDKKKEAFAHAREGIGQYCKSLWYSGVAKKMKIENLFDKIFGGKEDDDDS